MSTDILTELKLCELRVWDALLTGDKNTDVKSLHDSFLGVYPTGFATKADHVQQLEKGPTIESYELSNCRVLPLSGDCAVFSYRADFVRKGNAAPEAMYVSSIWQRNEAGWINVFSQDTPAVA